MAVQSQANLDQFEAYFRKADLDQDGRISGNEAVTFFQGSNLPRQVLAQIWQIADQKRTGFLGRQEFYNALKLVTVAQSKRELTPDIVKAALYGPASAAIPPPKIIVTPTQSQQSSVITASSSVPQTAAVTTMGSLSSGVRSFHGFASQQPQVMQPARPLSPSAAFQSPQVVASPTIPPLGSNRGVSYPTITSTKASGNTVSTSMGINSQGNNVTMLSVQDGLSTPLPGLPSSKQPVVQVSSPSPLPASSKPNDTPVGGKGDFRALTVGANGHAVDSLFGNVFSASPVPTKQDSPKVNSFHSSSPAPSAIVPASSSLQSTAKSSSSEYLSSTPSPLPISNQHPQVPMPQKSTQQMFVQASTLPTGATISGGQPQPLWPKMTQSDVQKYSKVFLQVDTDRDGKITGEQARNLFLSWRMPRDVLKQVWDLSDQDNDSMLSLREFCIALYLMERYREGRPLPAALPSNIMPDETLFAVSNQPAAPVGHAGWKATPGFQQPQVSKGARAAAFPGAAKPPRPVPVPQLEDPVPPVRQKPKVPVLEKHLLDQLSTEEQSSLNAKLQEATEAEKKVSELEKEISDAREKIKFYHSKMQELILYKSRCDNRLNEIYQRVSADKLELEKLGKKYEEKYRQAGDVASKLTLEEATFRDIQEKKMELYRAIVKLEQDGGGDKIQERVSHIQVDLEELVKSLNERCKSYGLRGKPTTLVELPFGWQPGIQGTAADWDENWDKFEDEGFTFVKELTLDVQNVIAPPRPKSTLVRDKETLVDESAVAKSSLDGHAKAEKVQHAGERISEDGEDALGEGRRLDSSHESPAQNNGVESKSRELEDSKKASFDGSPRAAQSEQGGAKSMLPGDRSFDDPGWGTLDSEYDADAAWDSNHASTKGQHDSSLFDTDGWNLQPIRTGPSYTDHALSKQGPVFDSVPSTPMNNSVSSPQADNLFQRKSLFFDSVPSTPVYNSGSTPHADNISVRQSPFFDSVPSTPMYNFGSTPHADNVSLGKSPFAFADSVPSSPMYNSGNSPRRLSGASEDRSFDSFSRFDSFNMQDSNQFSRFDSFNVKDSSQFSRFDSFNVKDGSQLSRFDSFSMQDGGLFTPRDSSLSRFDSMRSTQDSGFDNGSFAARDSFARFDSFRSTADSDYNFGLFPPRDSLNRFDSMRSTRDADQKHGFSSFDDADPFGSRDPFKTSTESQTPRRDSDSWKAF